MSDKKVLRAKDDDQGALEYAAQMGLQSTIRENKALQSRLSSNRKQLFFSLGVNICLGILLALMFIAFLSYPKTKYIATKDNASICEVYPTDNPNLTDATIREFGKDAILDLYTFDYINNEKQINEVLTRYFTPTGREATVEALNRSGTINYVVDNALTFKASAMNAVRIEQKAKNSDGKDYWVIRFPLVLDIYSGSAKPIDTQRHMATVRVVADTASVNNPNGLGISSVTLAPL